VANIPERASLAVGSAERGFGPYYGGYKLARTPIDRFRSVLIAKSDIDQSDISVDREILFRRSASLEAETNCGRYLEAGLS
jgi:hypothetical protein